MHEDTEPPTNEFFEPNFGVSLQRQVCGLTVSGRARQRPSASAVGGGSTSEEAIGGASGHIIAGNLTALQVLRQNYRHLRTIRQSIYGK